MNPNLINETDKKYILRFQQELLDLEYDARVKDVNTLIVEARGRKLELTVSGDPAVQLIRTMRCSNFYPTPRIHENGKRTFRYDGSGYFDEPKDFDEAVEVLQEQLNQLYKQGYRLSDLPMPPT